MKKAPDIGNLRERINIGNITNEKDSDGFLKRNFISDFSLWAEWSSDTTQRSKEGTTSGYIFTVRYNDSFMDANFVQHKGLLYEVKDREVVGDPPLFFLRLHVERQK